MLISVGNLHKLPRMHYVFKGLLFDTNYMQYWHRNEFRAHIVQLKPYIRVQLLHVMLRESIAKYL